MNADVQGRLTIVQEEILRCAKRLRKPDPGERLDDSVAVVASRLHLLGDMLLDVLNLLDE